MKDNVYNNWFGFEIPDEHIPNNEDMIQVASGDITIANKIIEGLTGFIVNQIDWFLYKSEEAQPFREDCISEALLALSEFVYLCIDKKKTYSPTHFVYRVRNECLHKVIDWLREMSIAVTIPARRQRLTGDNFHSHELLDYESGDTELFDEVWFQEFIDNLNEHENNLVRMKIDGCSDRKIAEHLNISPWLVKEQLEKCLAKFDEKDEY